MARPPIAKIFDVYDVHRIIIEYLSLRQLRGYGLVCRVSQDAVQALLRSSNNIVRLLAQFLPFHRIPYFRRVQKATGTLIGGSTALQLFVRQKYGRSDLDLYVNRLHVGDLTDALRIGISCERVASPASPRKGTANVAEELYLTCGVDGVQDFVSPTGRAIQVITTRSAPVRSILRYHSTTVMNFISASYAYALYGRETLEDFFALYTRRGDDVVAVRTKYERRGWETIDYGGSPPSETDASTFADMDRL